MLANCIEIAGTLSYKRSLAFCSPEPYDYRWFIEVTAIPSEKIILLCILRNFCVSLEESWNIAFM